MKNLHLLNANVYLTNFLLIPCIVLAFFIHKNINTWSSPLDMTKTNIYSWIWFVMIICLIMTVIFSNIHHMFMFGKNKFLHLLGSLDYKFSAPFTGLIVLMMNFIYIYYLNSTCDKPHSHLKQLTIPIYVVSLIYSLLGLLSFILKRLFLKRNHSLYHPLYITSHTFFHYMSYSGVILLFLLYYVENKEIYLSLFEKDTCLKN